MKRIALCALMLPSAVWADDPKTLSPVKMVGPVKTLAAACASAPPCGFTDWDETKQTGRKPAKKPDCRAVLDPSLDMNTSDDKGKRQTLKKKIGTAEVQIASVTCAQPKGIRGDERRYYAFVKRPDGWWRTDKPLFSYSYNEKYCGGLMVARWNVQPTRTFLGIAATETCLACAKNGDQSATLEMMLRFEPAQKAPVVYAPLVVGQRSSLEPHPDIPSDIECKRSKSHVSMKESWSGDDDLTLEGPATWTTTNTDDAEGLQIRLGSGSAPSTAGAYRFTR